MSKVFMKLAVTTAKSTINTKSSFRKYLWIENNVLEDLESKPPQKRNNQNRQLSIAFPKKDLDNFFTRNKINRVFYRNSAFKGGVTGRFLKVIRDISNFSWIVFGGGYNFPIPSLVSFYLSSWACWDIKWRPK